MKFIKPWAIRRRQDYKDFLDIMSFCWLEWYKISGQKTAKKTFLKTVIIIGALLECNDILIIFKIWTVWVLKKWSVYKGIPRYLRFWLFFDPKTNRDKIDAIFQFAHKLIYKFIFSLFKYTYMTLNFFPLISYFANTIQRINSNQKSFQHFSNFS